VWLKECDETSAVSFYGISTRNKMNYEEIKMNSLGGIFCETVDLSLQ
jgi:hypothetical protein